mmetsp:Transcript_30536/g.97433  ORF Transcript_30536/g.97433 Transcript_30536/m.97433 type:complete len:440 (-) Transcript_30536:296-1615(-)
MGAKVLGQEVGVIWNQVLALVYNVMSWLRATLWPAAPPPLPSDWRRCVLIRGPGGLDRLELSHMSGSPTPLDGATVGYNVPGVPPPFVSAAQLRGVLTGGGDDPSLAAAARECALVRVSAFSVNYADVTIRWGLYESALEYIGWPIVPGFDFSGIVEAAQGGDFSGGSEVFGFTMFGAYSSRVLVPKRQLLHKPKNISMTQAAALPAVAGTALHALALANLWPKPPVTRVKAVLVHSAAGGVGSTIVQMCKIMGCAPIVAVVGSSHKVQACLALGATHVIDKSKHKGAAWWAEAETAASEGYIAVFDANGVSTLQASYDHLSLCGRLVTYGFHSNLPQGTHMLNPLAWLGMAAKMASMPKFDPMEMVLSSKAVLGFNLSFFAQEKELIAEYMQCIFDWVSKGKLIPPKVTVYAMEEIASAHELIQSGKSIGKVVLTTDA